jgi:hypothetical protein
MSTTVTVLAIVGLVVGLVVLLVVINLLHGVLTPLRSVLADVQSAKTAPMLERGIPGTDQLGQTRRAAESIPPLALAYLQKLSVAPAPPPPPTYQATPVYGAPPPVPASTGPRQQTLDAPVSPAWKKYSS